MTRRSTIASAALIALVIATGCDKKADETAAMTTDSTGVVAPPAPQPAAELVARHDSLMALWNGEKTAPIADYYSDDAVVHQDTMTFTGKKDLMAKWVTPSLKGIDNLVASGATWTAMGSDFQYNATYSMDVMGADKKKMAMTGKYDEMWTKGADGVWRVKVMNITGDPAPATTTSK